MAIDSTIKSGLQGAAIGAACFAAVPTIGLGFVAIRAIRQIAKDSANEHNGSDNHQKPKSKQGHADVATA